VVPRSVDSEKTTTKGSTKEIYSVLAAYISPFETRGRGSGVKRVRGEGGGLEWGGRESRAVSNGVNRDIGQRYKGGQT